MPYNKLSNYKTCWIDDGSNGSVIYTETKIVDWTKDKITLNSDGWDTVTTKRKMNQASHQFCLGFGVFQKDYEWFVTTPQGKTIKYYDNMVINRD